MTWLWPRGSDSGNAQQCKKTDGQGDGHTHTCLEFLQDDGSTHRGQHFCGKEKSDGSPCGHAWKNKEPGA